MIRKTMRVGEVRTSIKLEPEFWTYLREVADSQRQRLSELVNDIASKVPERTNLASTLRTYAILHARSNAGSLREQVEMLAMAGSSEDLTRVFDACPLPALILAQDRSIRELNQAFALWLNLDREATLNNKLDHVMILRGRGLNEGWVGLFNGRLPRLHFNATYLSPGKVRTAQAVAVPLAVENGQDHAGTLVMFETLVTRN